MVRYSMSFVFFVCAVLLSVMWWVHASILKKMIIRLENNISDLKHLVSLKEVEKGVLKNEIESLKIKKIDVQKGSPIG
jgi:hypothetical protein